MVERGERGARSGGRSRHRDRGERYGHQGAHSTGKGGVMLTGVGVLMAVLLILLWSGIRVFNEYERGGVFRLGRISGLRTAGIKWITPIVARLVRVALGVVVMDEP